MRFKKWLLGAATVAIMTTVALPVSGGDIVIAPENRVKNRADYGVCWFAALESVGRQYGIKCLDGLCERVEKDGTGFKTGANDTTIPYWLEKTGVKTVCNPHGKSQKGAEWVANQLAAGNPVISCQNVSSTDGKVHLHAFLVVKFEYETQLVHYVDSNDVSKVHTQKYNDWYAWWYGRAYAVDIKANGGGAVVAKPPEPKADPRTPVAPGAVTPIAEAPPPKAMLLEHPTPVLKEVKVPSNQDIKDGVRRPDDTLRYGAFGQLGGLAPGYDYYSEFKKKNPAPRP